MYLLIHRSCRVHRHLVLVGDPDQSLYKCRTRPEEHPRFDGYFGDATIGARTHFRSTQIILDSGNRPRDSARPQLARTTSLTDRKGGDPSSTLTLRDELE